MIKGINSDNTAANLGFMRGDVLRQQGNTIWQHTKQNKNQNITK